MKRLVVYCPGYDLRPEHQSFQLIFREFREFTHSRLVEGTLSGLHQGLEPGGCTAIWNGHVEWPEGTVDTRFVQLGWRDIIRPDFTRSWWRTIPDAIRSFFLYATAGGYRAVFKSNLGHGLFCIYPYVGLTLYLLASVLPPLLLAPAILDRLGTALPPGYATPLSWVVLLAGSGLWMGIVHALMLRLERLSYIRYLLNSWHFMARLASNDHAPMLARIEELADLILALNVEADEDEELVFLSHSCGTFVAIYVLAAILRRQPDIVRRPGGFAFVTIGPAFDCLGGFGARHGFGAAMETVARSGVDWTDVYAPHDLLCGGRTDPVARYAASAQVGAKLPEPRRFSARAPDRLSPKAFRYLRFRYFQLHFCYFLASVRPGLFDVYRLTLGPKPAHRQFEAWTQGRD
ncbi:hypothetical protein [Stappia sp.]|uniref:hypothetical protein n=1 Tax=Stappia sp. TaxID=1870903 RepID=UPI003C7C83D2